MHKAYGDRRVHYDVVILAKLYQMYHYHWTGFTILYQIHAALLFNSKITDSKVFTGAQFLLAIVQSEAQLSVDRTRSLICPTVIDYRAHAVKSARSWPQSSKHHGPWRGGWGMDKAGAGEHRVSPN